MRRREVRLLQIYRRRQEKVFSLHELVTLTVQDVKVEPRRENENPNRESPWGGHTTVAVPVPVAGLLKTALCNSDNMQGVCPWISSEPPPVSADHYLGYLDD